MSNKHTELPWEANKTSVYFPDLAGGFDIANCPHPEANAAFIVKAVNSHDYLLNACKIALAAFKNNNAIDWNILEFAIEQTEKQQ